MIQFRPSTLYLIMNGSKLTDTAKRHICERFDSIQRKVSYSFTSKQTRKGVAVEDKNIALVREYKFENPTDLFQHRQKKQYVKNEKTFSNTWVKGTPDVIYSDRQSKTSRQFLVVDDIKSSYTRATFLCSIAKMLELRKAPAVYYWQLQAYMMLTNAQHSNLVYVLANTPQNIIDEEVRKASYGDDFEKACDNIARLHNYDDIDISERVFMFPVQRNNDHIELIKERVEYANKWIDKYIRRVEEEEEINVFAV